MDSEAYIVQRLSAIPSLKGHNRLLTIKRVQLSFLAISIFSDQFILDNFKACIKRIIQAVSFSINSPMLGASPDGLIVITNHLGLNKLTKIYPSDIERELVSKPALEIPRLENDDPFILLLAPVTEYLSRQFDTDSEYEIIYIFMTLEPAYEKILQNINAITIERNKSNQYSKLSKAVRDKIQGIKAKLKKPLIVVFPEGGTSGKSNFSNPYSLLEFKRGYKLLAKDLNFQILPVAVKFDSDINLHINVGDFLPPSNSLQQDREYLISLLEK